MGRKLPKALLAQNSGVFAAMLVNSDDEGSPTYLNDSLPAFREFSTVLLE